MRARLGGGEVWVALGVLVLGAFLMFQTSAIEVSSNYARVGPRVFPWIISVVLVLLGCLLLRTALAGTWSAADDAAERTPFNGGAIVWIGVGLVLYLVTITLLGFPIAAALLFAGAARAFGSRRVGMDVGLGLVLGIAVFLGFNYGLGLSLPPGILKGIL